jgi:hypothetical protein
MLEAKPLNNKRPSASDKDTKEAERWSYPL